MCVVKRRFYTFFMPQSSFRASFGEFCIFVHAFVFVIQYLLKYGLPICWGVLTFAALADPTRRAIVEMLARAPLTSGEIASRFTSSPSAVSQHLRVLRDARLVRVRAAGQQRIYELDADGLAEIEEWLDGIGPAWHKRLEAIERQRRLQAASPR